MAVDYVKTGEPAHMPSELNPRKWPHFMEKTHKPKEQIYVSQKVLGKLYDQVERVDFVPCFNLPFDKRILDAYEVDEKLLQDAAEIKEQYDSAMRRIMAQHDISTEFEVWSTFVLHHANQSKDYKFHEEMGEISSALKDRFRQACYTKAGGKDSDVTVPFVVAMYKVTAEEMARAVEECRQVKIVAGKEKRVRNMNAHSMPLMSFPWLFQEILGKVANGDLHPTERETYAKSSAVRGGRTTASTEAAVGVKTPDQDDTLETADGLTHRGQVLELFHHGDEHGHDATPPVKDDVARQLKTEENLVNALTDAKIGATHSESGPTPIPDDVAMNVPPEAWDMLEGRVHSAPSTDSEKLIEFEDGNTCLVDVGGRNPAPHQEQVTFGAGSQEGSVAMEVNDLFADDADLEQFNFHTASQNGDASPHSALNTPMSSDGSSGSINAAVDVLLAEYRGGDEVKSCRAQTGADTELLPVEDGEDGDGQAEEVTIHFDSKDSALEALEKLVG